jgi:hypothetical protein
MTTFLIFGGWFVLSAVLGLFLGPCIGGRWWPMILGAGPRPVDSSLTLTPGAASQLTPRGLYAAPAFKPEAYAELGALLSSGSISHRRAALCGKAHPRRMNEDSGALPCFTLGRR